MLAKTFRDDPVLLMESLLATFCFGTRIILAKYSSKVIGTFNFLKFGMYVDCFLGLILLVLSVLPGVQPNVRHGKHV